MPAAYLHTFSFIRTKFIRTSSLKLGGILRTCNVKLCNIKLRLNEITGSYNKKVCILLIIFLIQNTDPVAINSKLVRNLWNVLTKMFQLEWTKTWNANRRKLKPSIS